MPVVSRQELPPPSPAPARPAFRVSSAVTRRVKLVDRLADSVIRVGGLLVIAAIALIFIFIVREIVPLFLPASLGPAQVHALTRPEAAPLLAGTDEFESFAWVLRPDGAVEVRTLAGWEERPTLRSALLGGRRVTAASLAPAGGLRVVRRRSRVGPHVERPLFGLGSRR